jgi:hypothetical protein
MLLVALAEIVGGRLSTCAECMRPELPGRRIAGSHWFAGCGMLVAGGFCYGMLVDDGGSLVSRRIHRLLRVPPTGSSASWAYAGRPTPRVRPGGPGKYQPTDVGQETC